MITKEQSFFLSALSDHLFSRPTVMPDDLDIPALCKLAQEQECTSILYYQTHLPELESAFFADTYYAVNRNKLLNTIHDAFAVNNIPYLIFKGVEVAKYYPHPELRSMGDIDILVHKEDKSSAINALIDVGFITQSETDGENEVALFLNGYEIELHHRLLFDNYLNNSVLIEHCDKAWENVTTYDGVQYKLNDMFHFAFVLNHLRKHLLWEGVGIRQFADLAVMVKSCDMDWVKLLDYFTSLGLDNFAKICLTLVNHWFGVNSPLSTAELSDQFVLEATETIINHGVFGFVSKDETSHDTNVAINHLRKENNVKHGKIMHFLRIFFPRYSDIKVKYPKMAKSPILLPVLWIRRAIDAVIYKRAQNGIKYASKTKHNMDEREKMLSEWGL